MRSRVTVLPVLLVLALLLSSVALALYNPPPIAIHVYRDGSVVVEYSNTINTTSSSYSAGSASGKIIVGEKDFSFEASGWIETHPVSQPVQSLVTLDFSIVPEAGYLRTSLSFAYDVNYSSNVTKFALSVDGRTFPSNLTGVYAVSLHASSNSPEIINSIDQSFRNFISSPGIIKAEDLSIKRSENSIDARVNIGIYLPTFLRYIPVQIPVEKIAQLTYPVSLSISLKGINERGEFSVSVKIGTDIDAVIGAIVSSSVIEKTASGFCCEEREALEFLDVFIKEFHKSFRFLPSTGEFTISFANNTLDVSVKSPRFIARNATSITSTLKELSQFAVDMRIILDSKGKSKLAMLISLEMFRSVVIDLVDFTGTIMLGKKQTNLVMFGELPSVEIIPASGQSIVTSQTSTQRTQTTTTSATTTQPSTSQPQSVTSASTSQPSSQQPQTATSEAQTSTQQTQPISGATIINSLEVAIVIVALAASILAIVAAMRRK